MTMIEELPEEGRVARRVVVAQPRQLRRRRFEPSRAWRIHPATQVNSPSPSASETQTSTTSISKVLISLAVAFTLAFLLSSRGLVHSAQGMDEGTPRTVLLTIGNVDQAVGDFLRLTWPWDQMEAALGRTQQTSSPLLASSGVGPANVRHGTRNSPGSPSARSSIPRPAAAPIAPPTPLNPLRVLVTGDSLTEFLGPDLVDKISQAGPVVGWTDTHYGTGLVRPDFVDWSLVAAQQVKQYHARAVVVMIGGNDNQNMTRADGSIIYTRTAAWTNEYQRRAEVCMRIWTQGGKTRVYWLSMPPARNDGWTATNMEMDLALQRAARDVPGVQYLNILGPVTDNGHYSDYVTVNGVPTLVRASDGIHFTPVASSIVANEVVDTLERQWKFGPYKPRKK